MNITAQPRPYIAKPRSQVKDPDVQNLRGKMRDTERVARQDGGFADLDPRDGVVQAWQFGDLHEVHFDTENGQVERATMKAGAGETYVFLQTEDQQLWTRFEEGANIPTTLMVVDMSGGNARESSADPEMVARVAPYRDIDEV